MMSSNQTQRVQYCWVCLHLHHQTEASVKWMKCRSCIRIFHKNCVTKNVAMSNNEFICTQCIKIEDSLKDCHINKEMLQRSLNFLYNRLTDDDEYMELNVVTNGVNFTSIKSKIDEIKYRSCQEFMTDISWMERDSLIADASDRMRRISKELVQYCENEVRHISACGLCYELANLSTSMKWFSEVCGKSHPVVWAKVIGFPYEPAKLMSIQNETATVMFFGDHKIAQISMKHCLLYSEKSPNMSYNTKPDTMQEVQLYIKNMGTSFRYAAFGERLNTSLSSSTSTTSKHDWDKSIRKTINELLDKNEEHIELLKTDFRLLEQEYKDKIKDLERKLSNQKRQHEDSLRGLKLKKWCDFCHNEAQTQTKVFCTNKCGAKWYENADSAKQKKEN